MAEALGVIMRFVHIASMATLLGGFLFERMAAWPGWRTLAEAERKAVDEAVAAHFRVMVYAAISGLIVSGAYNLLSYPGHSTRYYLVLCIKLLLVAHIFGVALLMGRPGNPRRSRMASGAIVSGLAVLLISAYLKRIF
jgi:uncharacterized membrane protein